MQDKELKISPVFEPFNDVIKIYIHSNFDGKTNFVSGFETKSYPQGSMIEPAMSITFSQGQRLIDMLWDCGLRPTQAKGSAGQLDAIERHLQDFRKLYFSKVNVKDAN